MTDKEPAMHDLVALGDFKKALDKTFDVSSQDRTSPKDSETLRLPLFLRLLSSSQHLSFTDSDDEQAEISSQERYINGIVNLLEMVAASHRTAEHIDHLASFLAPDACRPVSRLLSIPLRRKRKLVSISIEDTGDASVPQKMEAVFGKGVVVTENNINGNQSFATTGWDDSALKKICGDTGKKENEENDSESQEDALGDKDDQSQDEDDLEDENDESSSRPTTTKRSNVDLSMESPSPKRKRKRGISILDRKSLEESDLPESTVCKILLEILSLVSSSLRPISRISGMPSNRDTEHDDDDDEKDDAETLSGRSYSKSAAAIKLLPASLLSEEQAFGSTIDSELSSTIVTLMYHAPIIRHEHLSNALCRASVPHCATIIKHLAANSPAASTALIKGCINAILPDFGDCDETDAAIDIMQCAKDSIKSIASLSSREALNAANMMRQSSILPDVMFEIMTEYDADGSIALLWDGLRRFMNEDGFDKPLQGGRSSVYMSDTVFGALHPKKEISLLVVEMTRRDPTFTSIVGEFILSQLELTSKRGASKVVWGQATIIVQTLGMFSAVGCQHGEMFTKQSISRIMNLSLQAYELVNEHKITNENSPEKTTTLPETSRCDTFIKNALSSCILICSQSQTIGDGKKLLTQCFRHVHMWHVSIVTRSCASIIFNLISESDSNRLLKVIALTLLDRDETSCCENNLGGLDLSELCQWVKDIHPQMNIEGTKSTMEVDQNNVKTRESGHAIKELLEDIEKSASLYDEEGTLNLLEKSIVEMGNNDCPVIPLVLPLSIGKLSSHFFHEQHSIESSREWRKLVIHLVYSFLFLEKYPKSPFSINPRSLELTRIIHYICESPHNLLTSKILSSIDRFCPEFLDQGFDRLPHIQDGIPLRVDYLRMKPKKLAKMVQDCINGNMSVTSKSRLALERSYLSSRALYESSEVDLEVARALLSSVGDSFHFLTHSTLCKDPLVLLKCSLKVWFNDDLRRILLLILNRVMMANENILRETTSSSITVSECLASRDALVARSFIFLLSSCCNQKECERSLDCPIMISMVRFIVAHRPGLSAAMIKQGLPYVALDWFIHYIPEVFSDAKELSTMLESRNLNILEKSRIADGSLRIAIVHGSCDNVTQRLVYNALSVLISSFHIVIGPVGVPVNVLCDEKEQDITQSCREHLFRMLAALRHLSSDRKNLKGEAILALSKLANLCKSDASIGELGVNALQKRKKLLEKVWDSIVKVNEAFGGGII